MQNLLINNFPSNHTTYNQEYTHLQTKSHPPKTSTYTSNETSKQPTTTAHTIAITFQPRIEFFANFQPARFPSNVFNAQSGGHGACGSERSCGKQIKSVHLCAISCTRVCMCHVCCRSCVAVRNVKYIRAEMPLIRCYVSFWAADKAKCGPVRLRNFGCWVSFGFAEKLRFSKGIVIVDLKLICLFDDWKD